MDAIDYSKLSPRVYRKYLEFNNSLAASTLDQGIAHLIDIRVSQINHCAFCLDMHVKEAKIAGETELRLHHIAVWRESPLFTAKEKAALAWSERLTHVADGLPDEAYADVRAHFSDQEIADLTFKIMAINGWNRINVAFGTVPGSEDEAFGLTKAGLSG